MNHVTFVFNGTINGRPSWVGYDGTTQLTILWNGTYWVMFGWPYDGEPRNYNDTYDPTTGWELYNNTTITATFDIVLGACPLPSVTPTSTPSVTPSITPSPNASPTPTPSITPSQVCNAPVLNNVILTKRLVSSYTFGLFFTPSSNCNDVIYEYSCDNIDWTSCGSDECGNGFGCTSPVQVIIDSFLAGCTLCPGNWYFRIQQCCPNGLQSSYSNTFLYTPVSVTPTVTPSVTRTATPTPTVTPTNSITPSITATPSVTVTPSVSATPGLCRYVTSLESLARTGNYVRIQYTDCAGNLQIFSVYIPTGSNIVDVSALNICMRVGTSLTILAGSVLSIQPIFGAYCS
jgi:hypothetical protein